MKIFWIYKLVLHSVLHAPIGLQGGGGGVEIATYKIANISNMVTLIWCFFVVSKYHMGQEI